MRLGRVTLVVSMLFATGSLGFLLGHRLGVRPSAPDREASEETTKTARAARELEEVRFRRDLRRSEVARLEAAMKESPVAPSKLQEERTPKSASILLPLDESVRRTAEQALEELDSAVALGADQKPKVQAILEKQMRPGIEQFYQGKLTTTVDEQGEIRARDELAQVLRPEQMLQYDRHQREKLAVSLKKDLEQSAEDCSDAVGLNGDQRTALRAALERDPLLLRHTGEDGPPSENLDTEMERYRQRQVRLRAAVAPLLTGDQGARFEEYLKKQENEYCQTMKLYLNFCARGRAANR